MMELKLPSNPLLLVMKQTNGGFSEQDLLTPIIINFLAI
jgi:hypothetical protein